ncbi:MAG: hypothetical protein RLZZ166_333 [Pseudomonadota bacterium]
MPLEGRQVVEPGPADKRQFSGDLPFDLIARDDVLAVPLVDTHHQGPPRLGHKSRDVGILVRDVLLRIE